VQIPRPQKRDMGHPAGAENGRSRFVLSHPSAIRLRMGHPTDGWGTRRFLASRPIQPGVADWISLRARRAARGLSGGERYTCFSMPHEVEDGRQRVLGLRSPHSQ
jgi:hypothetical protein